MHPPTLNLGPFNINVQKLSTPSCATVVLFIRIFNSDASLKAVKQTVKMILKNKEEPKSSTEPDKNDSSSFSVISMSSADSGVEDQQHSNNTTTSDFECDNAHYFEAKTLPLSVRKSNDSLASTETQDSVQGIPTVRKQPKPMVIEEKTLKKATGTDYIKICVVKP